MKKPVVVIGNVVIVAAILGAAYVLRPPAEATAPVEAPALPTATQAEPTEDTAAAEPSEAAEVAAGTTETSEATEAPAEVPTEAAIVAEPDGIYEIASDESQASFSIDEILRGEPFTAIGSTDQVAGQISPNFANPAETVLGTIVVNARTLRTNNNFRNRAINNEILDTGEFEFITFEPTSLAGLPESFAIGETATFMVTGILTIRDIALETTFEVTLTFTADGRLEGSATATVLRADYELTIPSVPSVADVSDEVGIVIMFVAVDP